MSPTLGEKLRQARDARGISVSEVAEQTRISPLYIKSIEEDDYRTLPGGIFNKGFVKSFAKCVGIDEHEALQDYAALVGNQTTAIEDQPKTYRPQVLTDDRASSSGLRTIVLAAAIVGLITIGILALMNYFKNNSTETVVNNTNSSVNNNSANAAAAAVNASNTNASDGSAPSMNDLKINLKALKSPVSITSTSDGAPASTLLTPDKPLNFAPKENLKIKYAKNFASNVQLTINDRQISLPTAPGNPKRSVIEIEITKDNLAQILQDGKISPVAQ